jgi:hypothetical protein
MPSVGALAVIIGASILGTAYFVYGKRQQRFSFLLAGIGLCLYPYVVDGIVLDVVVGVALAAAPFLIRD